MPHHVDGFKVCTNEKCKQNNPQSTADFHKDKNTADKLSDWCKSCKNANKSKWNKENPERCLAASRKQAASGKRKASDNIYRKRPEVKASSANRQLIKFYGITLDQKQEMVDDQHGKCGNVGCDYHFESLSDAMVDHCHKTGKVRRLLCTRCNWALGHLKEDISRILGLAEYVKDFQ